jgi:beta-glucosidase
MRRITISTFRLLQMFPDVQSTRKPFLILVILSLVLVPVHAQSQVSRDSESESRVDSILAKMTTEEKIDLLSGVNVFDVRGITRVDLPLLSTADGPMGVRNDGPATVMAGGISLAATWNIELAEQVGQEIGRDARAKGKYFLLGPGVNIYRSPLNGRNFEYFGEDPFLASRIAVGYIKGVQTKGVSATIKHFLGNNSEFGRNTTSSVIDERTLREVYLPVFEAAVKEAHVGAIMDSYNLTNGEYMTQNGYLNTDILKNEWGFKGIVMSDWGATHDTLGAFNGGLDLEMPSGQFLNRNTLLPAIAQGKITTAALDDKVRRILRAEIEFGGLDREPIDLAIPRYDQQGRRVALETAREGMILLKNAGNLLPLSKSEVKTIAIIGPDAYPAVAVGGGSAQVTPFHSVSFLEGLSDYLGPAFTVTYARGMPPLGVVANRTRFSTDETNGKLGLTAETFENSDLSGTPASTRIDQHINMGSAADLDALSSGEIDFASLVRQRPVSSRWTGYYIAGKPGTYDIFVQQGGFGDSGFRLYVDGALVRDRWTFAIAIIDQFSLSLTGAAHKIVLEYHARAGFLLPRLRMGIMPQGRWVEDTAKKLAARADVVVLAVGFSPESETEGWDRTFALPPGQDELIQEIVSANKNTVVTLTSGGAVDMHAWIDRVPGVIETWYPGQEGGTALAEILFGESNPSGHLPATFERRWEDNPTHDHYYPEPRSNRIVYKEGIFVGYRGFEQNHTKPLFPFGFGLSYTTFQYANLAVKAGPSVPADFQVSFDVTNAGKLAGAAVAQLYIADAKTGVPRPPKELKGFARVFLKPGETQRVSISLNARSFSYYDVDAKQWHARAGTFEVLVGSSSADIALNGQVALAQDLLSK